MSLSPSDLERIPESIIQIYQELEEYIIKDFARRISKVGEITSSAEWQALRAKEIGISTKYIKDEIQRILNLSDKAIDKLFSDSALKSMANDNKIFESGGLDSIKLEEHPKLKELINFYTKQTKGELSNFTNSLGFAERVNGKIVYSSIAKFYQKHLDLAQMKVQTGVASYNTAVKEAIKKLTDSGLRYVNYESGWSNNIDVAVRRVVISGTNQMASKMVDYNCDVLGIELIEVSAHGGARLSHQEWQGQVYTRGVATADYENFEEATNYGEADGLCGANCRHSYAPFIEGTARTWSKDELEKLKNETYEYEGKKYTEYEANQKQRQYERAIRQTKRELIGYKAAGIKEEFNKASAKLQQQKRAYESFSKGTGLRVKNERHQVYGFDRSIAGQSRNMK